ncbi:hypothetical protein EZY14_007620 [Kordia sp. TARA_039_SRF]|nr:hypothetical protein EZY14_007620 [Kordia sp. TARA_039_SRF]
MSRFKLSDKLGFISPFEDENLLDDTLIANEKWQRLIHNCRPHEVFNLNWNSYDPIKFADTFLPNVEGYQGKAVRFYDGAALFNGLRPSSRALFPITDSNKLITAITFSMPRGVEASQKKNRVQPRNHEVVTFIEIDQNDKAVVSFKFGQNFKNYLSSNKITPSSVEQKSIISDVEALKKHFDNTLSHQSMMNFVLQNVGADPEKAYANTKKGKLESFLKKNNIQSFIYKNVCKNGEPIVVHGTIVKGNLQLKYIDVSEVKNITKLDLKDKKEAILFKYNKEGEQEKQWTVSQLVIPISFNDGACPDITKPIEQAEVDHVSDLVSEHVKHTNREGAEKQYFELNNIIQKQLDNPFYEEVNLCVNLTIEEGYPKKSPNDENVKPLDGNQSVNLVGVFSQGENQQYEITNTYTSSFKKNDKPCGISLNIKIDASGKVSVKHKASPNYLKEYESKWDKEIKARGLEDEIDIKALREQVRKDFEDAEVEHGFFARFIQDARAFFNENIGGYIEAIQATQKVVIHVWDEGKINEGMWHSTGEDKEEYEQFPSYMHLNPTIGGVADGVVEEITGIPMAIKGIYELVTDEKQREALVKIFTKEGFNQMIQSLTSEVEKIKNDPQRLKHFSGKTTVSAATMLIPGMQFSKVGKLDNVLETATDGLKQIDNPKLLNSVDEIKANNKYLPENKKDVADFKKNRTETEDFLQNTDKEILNDLGEDLSKVLKKGEDAEVLKKARKLPGTSTGLGKEIKGKWLKGTNGNAGLFPKSVADKLRGKEFKNFDDFRKQFWKTVAEDPKLSKEFGAGSITRMKKGNAPFVHNTQNLGGQKNYVLHHKTPINRGGGVYDMDNLYIVTPRFHKEILAPEYHYGYGY